MSETTDVKAPRRLRRPNTGVLALGAVALVSVALFSVLVPILITLYEQPPAFAFLFGALLCGALLLAVRYPRWAIAAFTVSALALPLPIVATPGTPWPWPWSVPAMLTLFAFVAVLTVRHGWRLALAAWLLSIGGTLGVAIALSTAVPLVPAIVNLVIVTSISGATLLVAVLVASRLRVGAELTRERELTALEQSRRVLVEERARIARELHDVVAHGMSLIQVQASTARYRVPGLPAEALSEFDEIAHTARSGLTEMRRLLGVLRTEDQQPDLAPQQGLRDIGELAAAVRRAGAEVEVSLSPLPAVVPSAVDIAGFRIVQEALSNAVRHAPHARIDLDVRTDGEAVHIHVHNGPGAAADTPAAAGGGRGHGLLGMRERAALVGGSVEAGPESDGGWTVRAVLPLTDPTEGAP